MAGRSRRAWFGVLLGLVVGFTLASRLILPRASELKKADHKRKASPAACGLSGAPKREIGGVLWASPANDVPSTRKSGSGSFLFVGVMTAQKYLRTRAVAAHRYVFRVHAHDVPNRAEPPSKPEELTEQEVLWFRW